MGSKIGRRLWIIGLSLLSVWGSMGTGRAADLDVHTDDDSIRVIKNLPYESAGDRDRALDLYLPRHPAAARPPLIVMIHGGGWSAGDKDDFTGVAEEFVERGYAAASINYRLSQRAVFPAQIIDCKAAIRWLRAHASDYGFDPTRVVVGGHSAGGHLAALVGTTGSTEQFDRGAHLNQKSSVQAVLWFAGVGDLVSRPLIPGFESEQDPHSGESLLIGGPVLQTTRKAAAASPITYVNNSVPPFIFFHGDSDKAVPVAQAVEMYAALLRASVPAELHIIKGADHGGPGYFTPLMFDQIDAFLDKTLTRTAPGDQSLPLADGTYRIVPVSAPNLVLDARRPGNSDSTTVEINSPSRGAANQTWAFRAQGDGYYVIRPSGDQALSLTVSPGATADTTRVLLMRDQGQPNQRWKLHREIDGRYLLTPQVATGSALDDLGGATTPGSTVDIFTSGGYDRHLQWRITPAR